MGDEDDAFIARIVQLRRQLAESLKALQAQREWCEKLIRRTTEHLERAYARMRTARTYLANHRRPH